MTLDILFVIQRENLEVGIKKEEILPSQKHNITITSNSPFFKKRLNDDVNNNVY